VPVVGITNLEAMLASIPPYWQAYFEHFAQRAAAPRVEEGRALRRSRSPLYKAANISKPMLIGHGLNDPRCKIAESDQIVAAMREKDIAVTYVVFPDEGHGFARPENRLAFNAITEALPGTPPRWSLRDGGWRLRTFEPRGARGRGDLQGDRCGRRALAIPLPSFRQGLIKDEPRRRALRPARSRGPRRVGASFIP
jgi:Prolyl oligopeptidase family